jgi:hypothetical protein
MKQEVVSCVEVETNNFPGGNEETHGNLNQEIQCRG